MAHPWSRAHKTARANAIKVMVNGTRCPFCRMPMYKTDALDYDHTIPIVMGGIDGPMRLSHSHCNRSSGASIGNRLRRARFTKQPKVLLDSRKKNATIRPGRRLPKW
jgi:hypothetical protein